MVSLRMADHGDFKTLAEMRADMLGEEKPRSSGWNKEIAEKTMRYFVDGTADGSVAVWLAEADGIIVSMCCVSFFTLPPNDWCPNGKTAYIGNMYTIPEYRGRGIADRLLCQLIECAKGKGCQRILLHTTDAGRPLYVKHGFEDSVTAMAMFPFGISGCQ